MTTVISFIIVIGIIVFFHELGHFLAAKLAGVRVEVFSLGFPPKMISRKYGETEYQIAWIPLGGYVKMSGMLDESFDDDFDKDDPRGFVAQPFRIRFLIITAGVIMNFLLGVLLYSIVTLFEGIPVGVMSSTTISEVGEDSPADLAGMQAGDHIIEINGKTVSDWEELTESIRQHQIGSPISITWLRGDSTFSKEITPTATPVLSFDRDTVGTIGVLGTLDTRRVGLGMAVVYGTDWVIGVLRANVISLWWLVSGQARVSELTGPFGIAEKSGQSARSGLSSFVIFIAFISVSIGFVNILPIPMLDGGHLAFMLIEAVIKRPIAEKVKLNLMRVGLAALLVLILFVSYHDILRFFTDNDKNTNQSTIESSAHSSTDRDTVLAE